jgi:cytochrome c peroxidase
VQTAGVASGGEARARANLGRMVYYERFQANGKTISCNSCHSLTGWDPASPTGPAGAQPAERHARSLHNVASQLDYLQAPGVEERVKASLLSPVETGMPDPQLILTHLGHSPRLRAAFHAAFPSDPDPISLGNVVHAIAAFEGGLVTPSRWDQFILGDTTALTAAEKRGYAMFVATGCSDCHNGLSVGGRMFQRLGAAKQIRAESALAVAVGNRADPYRLRVASLRNVDRKVRPYFHFGAVTALDSAVRLMAHYQLGTELSGREVGLIVGWLKTLDGSIPREDIALRTEGRRIG